MGRTEPSTNPIPAADLPTVQWADALSRVPAYAAVAPPQADEPVFAELFWETVTAAAPTTPRGGSTDEPASVPATDPPAAARELRRTPDRGRRR